MALTKVSRGLLGGSDTKNLIINGAMQVAQRGASSVSLSGSSAFSADRFACYGPSSGSTSTVEQSSDAPTGFSKSIKYTCGTGQSVTGGDYAQITQQVEGYNTAYLNWGTSNAQYVTVSFWVKSSLTGTFAFNVQNATPNRTYVAQYTINSANTWEYKTINIAGDTSGTWETTNLQGIRVIWDMGFGYGTTSTVNAWQSGDVHYVSGNVKVNETSGATFYLTGVQLEVGNVATPFEHRSYGEELALCQRYYERSNTSGTAGTHRIAINKAQTSSNYYFAIPYAVTKRAMPTITIDQVYNSDLTISYHATASTDGHLGVKNATGGNTNTRALAEIHWQADAEL